MTSKRDVVSIALGADAERTCDQREARPGDDRPAVYVEAAQTGADYVAARDVQIEGRA